MRPFTRVALLFTPVHVHPGHSCVVSHFVRDTVALFELRIRNGDWFELESVTVGNNRDPARTYQVTAMPPHPEQDEGGAYLVWPFLQTVTVRAPLGVIHVEVKNARAESSLLEALVSGHALGPEPS